MEIYTHSFCSISRNDDWQAWLKATATDLYTDLSKTLSSKSGCKANSNKMQEIYSKLYTRGLGPAFEDFVTRRLPWLVKTQTGQPKTHKPITVQKPAPKEKSTIPAEFAKLNKHKVFESYNPNLLTFPQKLILTGDSEQLYPRVQLFCKDKLAVDYIIIEDHAYIEYFLPKFTSIIDRYPRNNREIFKYRQKVAQNG